MRTFVHAYTLRISSQPILRADGSYQRKKKNTFNFILHKSFKKKIKAAICPCVETSLSTVLMSKKYETYRWYH